MLREYFLLFRSAMRPEREAATSISRSRSGCCDDLPIVLPNLRKKLASRLPLIESSLSVRVERREHLGSDAHRYRPDFERQNRPTHGNDHLSA